MRLILVTLVLLLVIPTISNGQDEYTHPSFKKMAKSHKIIAILPWKFRTTLRKEDAMKVSEEEIKMSERVDGQVFQNGVYEFFMKKELKVELQDVAETNRILEENDIDIRDVGDYKHKDLAKMLGVDAMVSGNFKTNQPWSEEAMKVLAVLSLGTAVQKAHEATGVMRITDAQGTQLWRYSVSKTANTTAVLINRVLKKSARNIPYM